MTKEVQELSSKFSNIGTHILMSKNSFALFGNENNDDLVVTGSCKYNSTKPTLFTSNNAVTVTNKDIEFLKESVNSLTQSSAYAVFQISGVGIRLIKDAISKIDATHLRIHTYEDTIRISIFDYRKFLNSSRIARSNTQKILYYDCDNSNIGSEFSTTITASSFNKLTNQDMTVRINENGVCQFEPLKDDIKYLLRDQEVFEPVSTTFSDLLGCQISLSLAPNS
jgi:hypothetical protein